MGAWSALPHEIIHIISTRIDNRFDLIHFRSVCSWWRSSSLATFRPLPSIRCPLPPDAGGCGGDCHIVRRRVYLINSLSHDPPRFWLFKLQEDENGELTMHSLFKGLGASVNKTLSRRSAYKKRTLFNLKQDLLQSLFLRRIASENRSPYPSLSLDLLNSQVIELAQEDVACYTRWFNMFNDEMSNEYKAEERVGSMWLGAENKQFVILGRLSFEGLGMYRSFEERWTKIHATLFCLPEAVTFNGHFYAIGHSGVTFVVKPTLEVSSFLRIRPSRNKTWNRWLVKSEEKLLLVEMCTETLDDYHFYLEQKGWFEISELNKERDDWKQVEDLGGRVLFLNEQHCSFSCSPNQIPGFRPNSIIFMKHADHRLPQKFHNFYVFEFGEQGFKSFGDNPDNFQLFPSTEWLISNE